MNQTKNALCDWCGREFNDDKLYPHNYWKRVDNKYIELTEYYCSACRAAHEQDCNE